jgi:hypothetical protein
MQLSSMKKKIKSIEKQLIISKFESVIIVDSYEDIENYKDRIGPNTVIIIDDIGRLEDDFDV